MRTTQDVVKVENSELGYYSDRRCLCLPVLPVAEAWHAMIEDIQRLSGSRLGPGTLYGAIARLEQKGWIEPLDMEERRRPYRITAAGGAVLRARLATLQHFVKVGVQRLEAL